ncbi:hypothetical protein CJF42_23745 [Pseudoalteromonas sp. NBT06-2]|nr:hypothetical protein CJF42_23745 [Pseudoalteromonas sp. NBT06-2]
MLVKLNQNFNSNVHITNIKSNKKPDFKVLQQPKSLLMFGCSIDKNTIPFTLVDYLELADFSSRLIVPNKRGTVAKIHPKILTV